MLLCIIFYIGSLSLGLNPTLLPQTTDSSANQYIQLQSLELEKWAWAAWQWDSREAILHKLEDCQKFLSKPVKVG